MPTLTGTSAVGNQTVLGFLPLTVAQVQLNIPGFTATQFRRVGYIYVFAVNTASPFQSRLLDHRPVYLPGTYVPFSNAFGFSAVNYTAIVTWNESGLGWNLIYA